MLRLEAEQEAVLTSMGEELDAACRSLASNGEDKLQVFCFIILRLIQCCFVLFICMCLESNLAAAGQKRLQYTQRNTILIHHRLVKEHIGK